MPKKKKTRQQKILADTRRVADITSLYYFSSDSFKGQPKKQASLVRQSIAISTSSYQYLVRDLRKTAIFTVFIMLIELVLKFFTK